MTWLHVCTHIVRNTPEYRFELEEHQGPEGQQMLFAHFIVHKFAPGMLKRMKHEFALFRQCVTAPLYAVAGEHEDRKWINFVNLFGFEYLMDVVCVNGMKRRLYVHFAPDKEQEHEPAVLTEPKSERV